VFHQYVVRSPRREEVQARLKEQGVATAIHYPMPVHAQPAYAGRVALGPAGCVETEAIGREIFSLPIFPEMTEEQVGRVCAALAAL
jgi:dTDP-4-amino-4,6-dideoxygalactose transaminase